jgi:hypothetical protein
MRHLVETCEEFNSSKGAERQSIQRLIAFGKRRSESSSFVSFRNCDNLIFGLRKPSIYIGCLVNIEDRIAHLRKIARSIDGTCIIMYQRSVGSSPCFATAVTKSTQDVVSKQLRWATAGYDTLRHKGQTLQSFDWNNFRGRARPSPRELVRQSRIRKGQYSRLHNRLPLCYS